MDIPSKTVRQIIDKKPKKLKEKKGKETIGDERAWII